MFLPQTAPQFACDWTETTSSVSLRDVDKMRDHKTSFTHLLISLTAVLKYKDKSPTPHNYSNSFKTSFFNSNSHWN